MIISNSILPSAVAASVVLAGALAAGCGGETCGEACSEGVSCQRVLDVPADYGLDEATAEASAGECIALAPGSYGAASLQGGVSLLGPGAEQASVGSVTLPAGQGAVVRGLHVGGVVKLQPDAADVRLEALQITGSKNGVQAEKGASFTLSDSELSGVPDNGVLLIDAARARIERTTIHDGTGPGLWAQCSAGCGCASPPAVELRDVQLDHNAHTGVVLLGVAAKLAGVSIRDTEFTGQEQTNGGGLLAAACTSLDVTSLTVERSALYGVLVDSASGSLGAPGAEQGIIIVNSKGGGLWLRHIDSSLTVAGVSLQGNAVVGIDVGGGSKGIIIVNSDVADTASVDTQAEGWVDGTKMALGTDSIGDGLIWGAGTELDIDGLTLSGSGRNALLIDGPVSGSLSNVTLMGGDAAKGIVQQHASGPADAPAVTGSPAVAQTSEAPSKTPLAPEVPAPM